MIRIVMKHQAKYSEQIERYAAQLGISEIQFTSPGFLGNDYFTIDALNKYQNRLQNVGQRLSFIENVPWKMNYKIVYGLEGRDEQIANYIKTIRNMGKAGIPALGFNFMPNKVWRTSWNAPGRGGATVSEFDATLPACRNQDIHSIAALQGFEITKKPTAEQLWEYFEYFIKAVMPEAEKAEVRLALHPDDPPVPMIDGEARIFGTLADLQKAIDITDSPYFGLNLCLGAVSEMPNGAECVKRSIRQFVPQGKVFHVHFRGVEGSVPHFKECFIDEGNLPASEIMQLLVDNGYDGLIMDDHCPHMIGDDESGSIARAFAIGYMKGLLSKYGM